MLSALLASCTSSGEPNLDIGMNGNAAAMTAPSAGNASGTAETEGGSTPESTAKVEGDGKLPRQVAYLPSINPAFPSVPQKQTTQAEAAGAQTSEKPGDAAAANSAQSHEGAQTAKPGATGGGQAQVIATSAESPQPETPAPKKRSFLASLFGTSSAAAAPSAMHQDRGSAATATKQPAKTFIENRPTATAAEPAAKRVAEKSSKPVLDPDSERSRKPVMLAAYGGDNNGLPGVRTTDLFEIKRKSGIDDDSDVDIHEEDEGLYQLASASGMARLAPNGLLKQTESVDVACLKPALVRVLKIVEQRYGKKLIVTSGYRSRAHNIRVRGAKNSMHMYCAAADIQVPGVGKGELANFLRSMPGRGGVGTYCHTNSVHVDIGPERDWNWRCRRRS